MMNHYQAICHTIHHNSVLFRCDGSLPLLTAMTGSDSRESLIPMLNVWANMTDALNPTDRKQTVSSMLQAYDYALSK